MYIRAVTIVLFCAFWATKAENGWTWARAGELTCNAVESGITYNGTAAYLARAHQGPNLIPGFALKKDNSGAFINFDNTTYFENNYEILCSWDVAWQYINASANMTIPSRAFPVGNLENGKDLYACRGLTTLYHGQHISGYIDPETNLCNITWDKDDNFTFNYVLSTDIYEVLINISDLSKNYKAEENFYWEWDSIETPACPGEEVLTGMSVGKSKIHAKVTRVHYGSALVPGFIPNDRTLKTCYFSYDDLNVEKSLTYEVLCGRGVAWMKTALGKDIPSNAIVVGNDKDGSPMYSCRAIPYYATSGILPGLVKATDQKCHVAESYINAYDKIFKKEYFDILVSVPSN